MRHPENTFYQPFPTRRSTTCAFIFVPEMLSQLVQDKHSSLTGKGEISSCDTYTPSEVNFSSTVFPKKNNWLTYVHRSSLNKQNKILSEDQKIYLR